MTDEKAMPAEDKAPARNVSELVFPRDYGGNLGDIKRDGLKAISAMNGNIEKFRALKGTLETLLEFAETRMRIQHSVRKANVAAVIAAQAVNSTVEPDGAPVTEEPAADAE